MAWVSCISCCIWWALPYEVVVVVFLQELGVGCLLRFTPLFAGRSGSHLLWLRRHEITTPIAFSSGL